MAKEKVQNFENHGRVIPAYHGFVFSVLAINLGWSLFSLRNESLRNEITIGSVVNVLVAAALIVLFYYVRIFVLTVQDRVIRLEMQIRLERLLPADLRPRMGEFSVPQLISLRFASDQELPELARQVLDEKLTDRKAIKRRIKNWQADSLRA